MQEPASEEDQRIVQEMIGRFDAPSFIRRARHVEMTWTQLLDRCAHERLHRLEFVRLRLGQLRALLGSWEALAEWLPEEHERNELICLHDELKPRLRLPLEPTTSRRVLRNATQDLVEAMARFNAGWTKWIAKLDLRPVNQARDAYNRYYLLEKECAFGAAAIARRDYQQLEPITLDDVARKFPLLSVPRFQS